ncbi:MAG TPA: hypothetical protein PK971_02185, partial [Saprospiraceae bacterium]|nr:hypothetical protein [Saprospiraceae bacterium]
MASIEFPIKFDPTVLEAVSVTSTQVPGLVISADPNTSNVAFGTPNQFGPPGRIYTSWLVNFSQFSNGWSPPNGSTRIFIINFKALKDCIATLKIEKVSPTDKIEFANAQGTSLSYNIPNFNITVGSGNCPVPPPTYTGLKVIANNIYIPQGEIGCMPITSNEFKDIEAFQYSVKWTTISTLNYEGVRPFGNALPGFDPGLFAGFNNLGYQVGGWASTAGKVTVPNVIAPMYEVCFKAKGAAGASTYVTPGDMGVSPAIERPIGGGLATNLWTPDVPIGDTAYIVSSPAPTGTLTFKADVDTVAPNMTTCVDMRVTNFKGIEYAEFALQYDTTKVRYQSINLGTNPLGLTAVQNEYDLIVNPNITKGVRHVSVEQNLGAGDTLRYVHFRYYGTPATVADNTSIFSVCFKAVGPIGTNAAMDISSYKNTIAGIIVPIGAWKAAPISGVPVQAMDGNVFVKSPLSATLAPTNPTCNGGTNGSINTTTQANACTGTLSYKWAGPGINAGNMTVANPTGLTAGTYTLTVTCSAGPVTSTATITLTQPSAVAFANPPATVGVTCPGDANGSITLSMTGGTAPYNYTWSGPSSPGNTPNATNLKAGNYRVTVTDANNCAFNNNNNVIQVGTPSPITATSTTNPVKCFGGSSGTISLSISGGTSPYTVQWSGPNGFTGTGTSLSGLKGGDYTPTITDSKQCVQVGAVVSVAAPTTAMVATAASVGDVICFNTKTGKATVTVSNGTPNFTYLWKEVNTGVPASTAKDPDNLSCGTYTVVVTDGNQCTATSTAVTINCPIAALAVTATPTAATCGNNGKICLSISGGWSNKTVSWSATGISGECPTGVGSGTYTATVTDEKGCSDTTTTTVAGPPQFTLSETITHVTCFGAGNGAITVVPGGGAGGPYQVNWSGGANLVGPTISNLQPGQYTPVVTDKEGCSQSFPAYTVNGPAAIAVVDTNVTHQVGAGNNGAIEVTGVTGGTSPYSFSWTGPNGYTSTSQNIQNVAPGVYVLTIKDKNNCTFTASCEVKADFSATAILKKGACGLSKDGCITVDIVGTAPGPYMVSWTGNTNPVTLTTTPADICQFAGGTVYTLTVTNSLGQVFTMQPVSVPVLDAPMYSVERSEPNEDLKNGKIKVKAVNGPLDYNWSNGETGTNTIVQLDSGTYTVTITHFITGCTAVETYHLSRIYPPADFKWIEVTNPKCKASTDGVLRIQFTGADGPGYKYKWAGPAGLIAGATTTTLGGIGAGTYTVTVTDERGLNFVYDTVLVSQSLMAISTVDELSNINGFQ